MNRTTFIPIAVAALVITSGCTGNRLNFGPPGTIGMQREKAVIHDPYPSNDLGPPIVGGRPAGFDLPLETTKRLQVNPHAQRNRRGSAAPPYYGF